MKRWSFAVLPDVQLGRKWININFWDGIYFRLRGIPTKPPEAVVGQEIAERLRKTVEWLNAQNLKFVTTVGDLTDYATEEQLRKVSEILSKLKKPFVPLWGNHDVWPVILGLDKKAVWEGIRPLTVAEFESYFKEWKNSPCFRNFGEQKEGFQNYTFVVNGVRFITVDNNSRKHAPFGLPGQDGVARLYSESQRWLENLVFISRAKRIIVLSHAPLKKTFLKELADLSDKNLINIAGHKHKRSEWKKGEARRIIVNALYQEPFILMVQVEDNTIKTEYHRI